MTENSLYGNAERYFDLLRMAENERSYANFMSYFDHCDDESFTEQKFLKELDEMTEEWGNYKDRHYLCTLKGFKPDCTRFVWKVSFEKGEIITILGIVKDGTEYKVNEFYYH